MDGVTQLTKETLDQLGWQGIIASCTQNECFEYCSAFSSRASRARESGNHVGHEAFALLSRATLAAHKTGSNNEPFFEEWLLGFAEEELTLFRQLATDVIDPEMRARLADIVWERRHDPHMGRLAVDSYLKSASTLGGQNQWVHSFERLERATNLARVLGKSSEHFGRAISHVEDVLNRQDGNDSTFFSAQLMELLQEHKQGDNLKYAALAEVAATRAIVERDWERARRYLFVEAEWYFRGEQREMGTGTRLRMLETHVEEANEIIRASSNSLPYSHACHSIERAIKGYQEIGGPGTKGRRSELYLLLREYQKKAQGELSSFPLLRVDDQAETVTEHLATHVVDLVKGQSVPEALRTLACLPLLQDVAQLRETVERYVRTSPAALLLPLVMLSADGRVSGRPSSKCASQEEQMEAEIKSQMFTDSNESRMWRVRHLLLPAVDQVKADSHIRMDDLKQIVVDNPFTPEGREFFFAKGLHAGFMGDYLNAAHWLIPELENSIRHVLTLHGAVTSGFNRHDIQNHYNLNGILNDSELVQILTGIYGENLVFEMKSLLVQHFGANLRNEIAHGTLGVNEFNSDFYALQLVYLWWLALRLCFTTALPT